MKRILLIALLAPLTGCTMMVTPPVAMDGWVTPCYPQVTAWEYARANGCIPRPYPTVVYAPPTDPEIVEAENRARAAEAELARQKKLNEAKAREDRAKLDLQIARGEVVIDKHGNAVPVESTQAK
jgi:hypothetical protein